MHPVCKTHNVAPSEPQSRGMMVTPTNHTDSKDAKMINCLDTHAQFIFSVCQHSVWCSLIVMLSSLPSMYVMKADSRSQHCHGPHYPSLSPLKSHLGKCNSSGIFVSSSASANLTEGGRGGGGGGEGHDTITEMHVSGSGPLIGT